jgi:D-glycero-alpha-D-manno-heptose-7-phosphate kinase
VIITRTPFRISIGGGGTDLPSYYEKFGGFVISAAINKYAYISINEGFTDSYIIRYSQQEAVDKVDQIKHPIVREALKLHNIGPRHEVVSVADIPAGTGLGSSGSFTVGLLKAIYAAKREHVTTNVLAEEACHIEMNILGEPVGKQDQYIAAFGGLTCFEIEKDGSVRSSPLRVSKETLHTLEDNLLLFFTGQSRSASNILADQKTRSESSDSSMIENLHHIKELGLQIKTALENGKTTVFGELMHQHWLFKKERSKTISNPEINGWYDLGVSNGAVGGKLIGAGGGGFIMFYANDRTRLRQTMAKVGLREVRFAFDLEGSKILVQD